MNVTAKRCGACRRVLLNERRDYCAAYTRERFAKGTKTVRKRRLRTPRTRVRNGGFSSSKSAASKPPSTVDLGAFVREQIEAQKDQPNPVIFAPPDGT